MRKVCRRRRLEGWNHIPSGYGAQFDVDAAPWWLRKWFHTPFIDRFAYPVMVDHGYGILSPHPHAHGDEASARAVGWRIATDKTDLPPASRAAATHWLT